MECRPISLKEANSFVRDKHRHHAEVQGHKFSISAWHDGELVGVCIVGRPVSRHLDDGLTLEVTRLCTDGTYNACSFLYSRAARIAKDMGYKKIITYILETENGASLKAANWHLEDVTAGGGAWSSPSRPRQLEVAQMSIFPGHEVKYPICGKQRWGRSLND